MNNEGCNNMLEYIRIKAVKGIDDKKFDLKIYPNKPSILVAPNGFGKSSLATAFNSFNSSRITLDDDNVSEGHCASDASIEIKLDDRVYNIDSSQNTLNRDCACFVINSSLYAKEKGQYMGSFMGHKALLAIQDIELESKVPNKPRINYSISRNKSNFGKNGKILTSILYLIENTKLIDELKKININEFKKVYSYKNPLINIKNKINTYVGTAETILSQINEHLISDFGNIECLHSLKGIIEKFSKNKENNGILYLESIQLVDFMLSNEYGAYATWCAYKVNKEYVEDLISNFDTTHSSDLKITEQGRSPRKLTISFPSAKRISNGQRDILTFISKLYCARRKLKKENNILIIDEIFDYLDDANLVAFQYYILKFIKEYKKDGKKLYCILLTHLDPEYFHHFCFNKTKLQIRYLQKIGSCIGEVIELMKKRDSSDNISKFLFHFHNEERTIEGHKNKEWYRQLYKEVLDKYLTNKEYNCLNVCLAVRIKIEELAYQKLNDNEDKICFLEKQHGTNNKLEFIAEKGINYPEVWSLLGLIYNDNLHWKENRDFETPLKSKLSHFVIKNMIKILFKGEIYDIH